MFCENCRSQISETEMYCPVCGAPTITYKMNLLSQQEEMKKTKKKKKRNGLFNFVSFVIVSLEFIFFALILGGFYIAPYSKPGNFTKLLCTFCVILSFPFYDLFLRDFKGNKIVRMIRWALPIIIYVASGAEWS